MYKRGRLAGPCRAAASACRARLPDGLELRLKHSPLASVVVGTVHDTSGHVMLGSGPNPHAACWHIKPGPKVQTKDDHMTWSEADLGGVDRPSEEKEDAGRAGVGADCGQI
jgi:hypothetical protein